MTTTDPLSPDQRAILRLLLSEWLDGTVCGRAILAELPREAAIEVLLSLRAEGLCRFVYYGELEQDGFCFAVEGLPDPAPALARIAAGGRMVH